MAEGQPEPQSQEATSSTDTVDNVRANRPVTTSLYVGDLDPDVTLGQLYDFFNQVAQVASVRVCRDSMTGKSLGYGYVNISSQAGAATAIEALNFTRLNGRTIRVMYSQRDPSVRKSGAGNIFIKNLDKEIDHKALHDTFSAFGNILSCKVAMDTNGQSKGFGFVQFENEETAKTAIEKLNGMLLNDKQVFVGPFLRRQERESLAEKSEFKRVFVKNLTSLTAEEDLKILFGEFGPISNVAVIRHPDGRSKRYGFVIFENKDDAARSIEALNGKWVDGNEWYVAKALTKSEMKDEFEQRYGLNIKERQRAAKERDANLYVKNLDDSIDDDKLKALFSPFGTIISFKVMRAPNGISKGFGFVTFSTAQEAYRAIAEMNGRNVVRKPLYVTRAQKKEERRAKMQELFSQTRPIRMSSSVAPRVPMYPPVGLGHGQQMLYGQAPHTFIPSHLGFGYPQHLMPGMRPGFPPMPNFFMPLVQQGPLVQRCCHISPWMQQQMPPRGRVYRGLPDPALLDSPMPRDAVHPQTVPVDALASALVYSTPDLQRAILGTHLYPLVQQLEPEKAPKITGMLLEMDQTEVLHLLESPGALKSKVAEALEVLRASAQQQQADKTKDQLASLSLTDS